jgi:hypothetical protein
MSIDTSILPCGAAAYNPMPLAARVKTAEAAEEFNRYL